ncbi:N-acetylneuraminate synthase family protein [Luminiphilus sp.]|nr:N-acetylneuraminate synthase family protein [Luminiphilus sp.]
MTIGAIVLARCTSHRLPGKVLRKIAGKELLAHIVDGLNKCKALDKIVIATSDQPEDNAVASFCQSNGILVFRGSLTNVAERFLGAAESHNLTHAVRINGDNLFINPELVDAICLKSIEGFDFVSNVPNRTYPKGMSIESINTRFYRTLYGLFYKNGHFEHVTSYLYQHDDKINKYYFRSSENSTAGGIQLAIDTKFDFERASKMLSEGYQMDYKIDLELIVQRFKQAERTMNFRGKYGPLLIAEIGGNHEGDFGYAKRLTKLAIDSDADVVKFQMYSGNTLVNPVEAPDRHKHFKKFELSKQQYIELAEMVTQAGKMFMASIWNVEMIDWVDKYNPIYKIGSGDLLTWPLLAHLATRNKPIILSTGLATEEEVMATVEFLREQNEIYTDPHFLSVLQCTSMYPIPPSAANLDVMQRLKHLTKATVGYSDHTEGASAVKTAISMGAEVLEFHFTDCRDNKEFRDHKVSLTKDEVLDLINHIKMVDVLRGSNTKAPTQIELDNDHVVSFRRAVYPARDIPKGQTVSEADFTLLRPCNGLSSRYIDQIVGKKTRRALTKFERLCVEDFS